MRSRSMSGSYAQLQWGGAAKTAGRTSLLTEWFSSGRSASMGIFQAMEYGEAITDQALQRAIQLTQQRRAARQESLATAATEAVA